MRRKGCCRLGTNIFETEGVVYNLIAKDGWQDNEDLEREAFGWGGLISKFVGIRRSYFSFLSLFLSWGNSTSGFSENLFKKSGKIRGA